VSERSCITTRGFAEGASRLAANLWSVSSPKLKRRPRPQPLYEQRESWVFSVLTFLVSVVVAYLGAIFAYAAMNRIASIPTGEWLSDPTIHASFMFIQLAIVTVGLLVPLFNKEIDRQTRQFVLMLMVFLICYTALKASGIVDPNIPFNYFLEHVIAPLQRSIGH
jgi:uncharacterized membrane protein YbjE (DUF340 family)